MIELPPSKALTHLGVFAWFCLHCGCFRDQGYLSLLSCQSLFWFRTLILTDRRPQTLSQLSFSCREDHNIYLMWFVFFREHQYEGRREISVTCWEVMVCGSQLVSSGQQPENRPSCPLPGTPTLGHREGSCQPPGQWARPALQIRWRAHFVVF